MKVGSTCIKTFWLTVFAMLFLTTIKAQEIKEDKQEKKTTEIRNLIESKKYTFIAQYAVPARGRTVNLTTIYDLKVAADTVISELPYYGRAFVAPINPDDAGITFTSMKFDYTTTNRKKGGWDISIKPKDARQVQQMYLTVSENGYASLNVISNNRDAIAYNGYIK